MIDGRVFERIRKRIEGYEPDMIRLQAALTAIPALAPENGGDGEMKKAAFLVESPTAFGPTSWCGSRAGIRNGRSGS